MPNARLQRSRVLAALLLSLCLILPACGAASPETDQAPTTREYTGSIESGSTEVTGSEETTGGEAAGGGTTGGETTGEATGSGETTSAALRPEDVLSEEERKRIEAPKAGDWYADSGAEPVQIEGGGSAGAIPAVKPFNFGRDPGGPSDKTLFLTVPKLGIEDVPAFDSVEEEKLEQGTIHVPATGFPWQEGANTYIAGHRVGYPGTLSDHVFYDLESLVPGDEIILRDAAGDQYVYRVTEQRIVPPDNVEVMNAVPGRSLVTLQTCTLPDYSERVVVQGELV